MAEKKTRNKDDFEAYLKKILKDQIDSKQRHILIRLYNAYNQSVNNLEPEQNLLQIEASYKKVRKMINQIYKETFISNKFSDGDIEQLKSNNIKNFTVYNTNFINELKSNKNYELLKDDLYGKTQTFNNRYFLTYLFEHYIMLSDCLANYDENEADIKKRTILLLTEMEALLKLSVTYPSQIKSCVDSLIKEEGFVKRM